MPSNATSSVLTEETNPRLLPIETFSSYSRRGLWPQFLAAERMYAFLDDRKLHGRDRKISFCRSQAWFVRHQDTGEVRVSSNSCHLRWCPVCARTRKNYITHSVANWLRNLVHAKFLTLTLRHSDTPLYYQIHDLYSAFIKLRRRKFFTGAVPGGVWFFQVKKSKNDGLWHPHIHCLIHGDYIPVRQLKHTWRQCTHGSDIVDIRPIHNVQGASNEVARYASSPGSLVGLSVEDAAEMASSLEGRRVCGTWGTGRAVSLRPPRDSDKTKWVNIGSFTVIANTRSESLNSRMIWNCWQKDLSLPPGVDMILDEDKIVTSINKATERSPPCLF